VLTTELRDEILQAATRAPSAHNAQPWRLSPVGPDEYLLWYAYADRLLADPDDRDALMAMGAFYETLRLEAESRGMTVELELTPRPHDQGITLGTVSFAPLAGDPDPLAGAIARRQANRNAYQRTPLPPPLGRELEELGNLLLDPARIAPLVGAASVMAWKDDRFVTDLREWTRFDHLSPDGMTVDCLDLSRVDQLALKFALRRGRLPGWLARVYASRDVRLTRASSAMAILVTEGRDIPTLFECGRRLLRSWTLINSAGYSWHPMSIVIDQPTVEQLRGMVGGADGVAIYRVGYTPNPAPWSKRRSARQVLAAVPE
jgi:hypothetical protein